MKPAIDLEKLDRLEERAAAVSATIRALHDRYRDRINSANQKRLVALGTPFALQQFGAMSLAELGRVNPADLKAVGADLNMLASAFRDAKAAAEINAESERKAAAYRGQLGLVHRLRAFAGRE